MLGIAHSVDRLSDLVSDRPVLCSQVQEGYVHAAGLTRPSAFSYRRLAFPTAPGDGLLVPVELDPVPAGAHPAHDPARVSHHQREVRNVLQNHRSGPDEGVLANGHPAKDRAVRPERGPPTHQGLPELLHPANLAPGVVHVREHDGGAAEDVVFEGDAFIDGHVVLDLDRVADGDVPCYEDILPDPAVSSDLAASRYVAVMPDVRPGTDLCPGIDVAGFVDKTVGCSRHGGLRNGRRLRSVLQAALIGLQNTQHAKTLLAVRARGGTRVRIESRKARHSDRKGSVRTNATGCPSARLATGMLSFQSMV